MVSGAEPCTLRNAVIRRTAIDRTYSSPIMKESPAFTDGTKPNEPTSTAAASLEGW